MSTDPDTWLDSLQGPTLIGLATVTFLGAQAFVQPNRLMMVRPWPMMGKSRNGGAFSGTAAVMSGISWASMLFWLAACTIYTAAWYLTVDQTNSQPRLTACWWLPWAGVVANKLWSPAFFEARMPLLSMMAALLNLAIAIALAVVTGVWGYTVPVILFSIYAGMMFLLMVFSGLFALVANRFWTAPATWLKFNINTYLGEDGVSSNDGYNKMTNAPVSATRTLRRPA